MTPETVDPGNFEGFLTFLLTAAQTKQWWVLASAVLTGVVAFTRWFTPKVNGKLGAFLKTDRGGALLVLFWSAVGAVAHTFAAGKRPSAVTLLTAVVVAVGGAGGYVLIKKIFWPSDAEPAAQLPKVVGKEPPPPINPGLFLPIAFAALFAAGCACQKPENKYSPGCRILEVVVTCGGSALSQGLAALVQGVLPAIAGAQIDWGAIATLEKQFGTEAVVCALHQAGVVAEARSVPPSGLSDVARKLIAAKPNVVRNVQRYMAERHVVVQPASAP